MDWKDYQTFLDLPSNHKGNKNKEKKEIEVPKQKID